MDKTIAYGLLILILGMAIGYSVHEMSTSDDNLDGMQIPEMSAHLRSVDENNTDRHIFFYDFLLYNSGDEEVYVTSVEPVFSEKFSKMTLTDNNSIVVDKTLNGTSWVEVSGQVEFNTTGLSKEEIIDVTDRNIPGFRISSTETIYWSWVKK